MTTCTVSPLTVGADGVTVSATMMAMYEGTDAGTVPLAAGGPVHVAPQWGIEVEFSKPRNWKGAAPPDNVFATAHCDPQNVTLVPTSGVGAPAVTSPTTKAPPVAYVNTTTLIVLVVAA